MRMSFLSLSLTALLLPVAGSAQAQPASPETTPAAPAYVTAAMHDPARKADAKNDARRQMAAVMAFTGVKPGDTVIELVPGSGYWTRVFSQIVGPKGHVYTVWPKPMLKYSKKSLAMWKQLSATPHYANVTELVEPAQTLSVPAKADVVFTSQNYHDYHNLGISVATFDQSVRRALKPHGAFVIIDHVAPAGSGTRDTNTLHRIDPAAVKKELLAAGFRLDGSSDVLRNRKDPHDVSVFDKSIRGHTDQFILRFRPAHASPSGY